MLEQSTFKKSVQFYLFRREIFFCIFLKNIKFGVLNFFNFPKRKKHFLKIFQKVVIPYWVAVGI